MVPIFSGRNRPSRFSFICCFLQFSSAFRSLRFSIYHVSSYAVFARVPSSAIFDRILFHLRRGRCPTSTRVGTLDLQIPPIAAPPTDSNEHGALLMLHRTKPPLEGGTQGGVNQKCLHGQPSGASHHLKYGAIATGNRLSKSLCYPSKGGLVRSLSKVQLFGEKCLCTVGVGEQGFAQGSEGRGGFGGVGFCTVTEGFAELGIALVNCHIDYGAELGGE